MYILLTSATQNEIATTIQWLQNNRGNAGVHEVEVLITGIGGTATAHALMQQFTRRTPELVLQAGIAGSFREEYGPCTLVVVKEEVFADIGAFGNDGFDDVFDFGLASVDEKPFRNRLLVNPQPTWRGQKLPAVRGATVNCISSTMTQVKAIANKYNPDIESMEGAALHYTCIMEEIPFLQIRCISNFVGERDKNKWMMKEAIADLNLFLKETLPNL